MISRDEAFAQAWKWGWRNIWIMALIFVLGFAAISALGSYWERVEIANAVQRGGK